MTNTSGIVTSSAPITVQIIDGPRISLFTPSTFYLAPAAIDLFAIATAPATPVGSTITKVEYLNGTTVLATFTAPPYIYRWRNVVAGTYNVSARVTDSNAVTAASAPISITVGTSGSISAGIGINGSTIDDDSISFTGTFSAPPNSSVTVNGQLATVTANGQFHINDLALSPGANTLNILVNTLAGPQSSQTITVNRSVAVPTFKLTASPSLGIAPVNATLTIVKVDSSPLAASEQMKLSCHNPTKDQTAGDIQTRLGEYACAYPEPGVYYPSIVIRDASGSVIYFGVRAVVVNSPYSVIALARGVYTNLIDQLAANNKAGALTNFFGHAQGKYDEIFTALGASLPNAAAQLGNIGVTTVSEGLAEITLIRDINGVKQAFAITLFRGTDGIWRIESM
jgi:Glucodextranase, domain B